MNLSRFANLVASTSPNLAFYRLHLTVSDAGGYLVVKESGARGRVLDRREWPFADEAEAHAAFERRLREKLSLRRKTPRRYRLTDRLTP